MHKTASQDLETVMSEDDVRAGVLQVFERDFDLISREETTFGNQVNPHSPSKALISLS